MGEAIRQCGPVELARPRAGHARDRFEVCTQRLAVALAGGQPEAMVREGDQAFAGLAKKSSSAPAFSTI